MTTKAQRIETMTITTFVARLRGLGVCEEVLAWVRTQPDPGTAWRTCPRGDWMLWLCGRLTGQDSDSLKTLVLCAAQCARLRLADVPAGEDRPRVAIETAENWARGNTGVTDVRHAADAVADAAATVTYAGAYAVAYAAASLACADDLTYAAYYAAAGVAYTATDGTSYADAMAQCADIVRLYYSEPPLPDEPRVQEYEVA